MPLPVSWAGGLAEFEFGERYEREWAALGFSPQGHPVQFVREALTDQGVRPCASLQEAKVGQKVTLGGLILRPHRPPAAGGCLFFSLEDETALIQATLLPGADPQMGAAVYQAGNGPLGMARVTGRADMHGTGVSLRVEAVHLAT